MINWLRKHFAAFDKTLPAQVKVTALNDSGASVNLVEASIRHKKLADAHFDQGRFEEAITCYQKAIYCNPDFAEAFNNLSGVCSALNRLEEAERYLKEAVRIKPELANAHYNLAILLLEQKRPAEATQALSQVLKHNPKHYAALAVMLNQMQRGCSWENLHAGITMLRNSVYSVVKAPENIISPFIFITLPGTTPEEQKICAQNWAQLEFSQLIPLRSQLAFDHNRPSNPKVVIGYLSADFHDHATARLMAQVFELHNRTQFTITAYSYGPDDGSPMRRRLTNTFDQFFDIRSLSDVDAAKKIYADRVDILVDLKGYTADSRSGILALRPAPKQVNYLGYPGTMGAAFVDFLIADRTVIPVEMQKHYTEKVVCLPNCYQPNDRTRRRLPAPTRESCGLPKEGFVFCCFNQTYKITPEIFDVWCRLLDAAPGSVLWLFAATVDAEKNLRQYAISQNLDPGRLVMAYSVEPAQHLARLQCADLFLDTTPYNAHTTCSDALWMGLPVVTCMGQTFASRVAGSLLSAMGAAELITHNLEDYYDLALDLATNRERIQKIRSKILINRNTSPLFDSLQLTHDLEDIYVDMLSRQNGARSE